MADFQSLSTEALQEKKSDLQNRYDEFKSRNITLDMTRGKPCSEQLDLAMGMLECVQDVEFKSEDGTVTHSENDQFRTL